MHQSVVVVVTCLLVVKVDNLLVVLLVVKVTCLLVKVV